MIGLSQSYVMYDAKNLRNGLYSQDASIQSKPSSHSVEFQFPCSMNRQCPCHVRFYGHSLPALSWINVFLHENTTSPVESLIWIGYLLKRGDLQRWTGTSGSLPTLRLQRGLGTGKSGPRPLFHFHFFLPNFIHCKASTPYERTLHDFKLRST